MAVKKTQSNVARSAKKSSFQFRWWMAVLGIGVIAIVGIAVLQLSHAGTSATSNYYANSMTGGTPVYATGAKSNVMMSRTLTPNGVSFTTTLPTTTSYTLCVYIWGIPPTTGKILTMGGGFGTLDGRGQGGSGNQLAQNGWNKLITANLANLAVYGPKGTLGGSVAGKDGAADPSISVTQFTVVSGSTNCPTN